MTGAIVFWLVAIILSFSFGSGDTVLHRDVSSILRTLGIVYLAGTAIAAFSPLGSLVQMPSLIIGLPLLWYLGTDGYQGGILDSDVFRYGAYSVAFVGTMTLFVAIFVGVERPGNGLSMPPRSRVLWWQAREGWGASRPFPRYARMGIVSMIVATTVVLASFTIYARTSDVSELDVSVVVNGEMYGSVNFTVYLDGETVRSGMLMYDNESWVMDTHVHLELPSGSHKLELDVWNDSPALSAGTIDCTTHVRTLPYTEETAYLLVGAVIV